MRLFKEPLFHFILIGAAIFGWFSLIAPESTPPEPLGTITVDDGDMALLITRFETTWKRAPSAEELQALTEALVREEILVREARKLGLDRGDQVIRARLAQKMDFLTTSIASSVEPETEVLQAFLDNNAARFTTPPQIAFDQIYMGEAPNLGDIEAALSALNAGEDGSNFGVRSLLPASTPLSASRRVDSTFGNGFSEVLWALKADVWSGPIPSAYGQHLVRVTYTLPPELPALEDIRDAVLLEWRREVGADLAQAQYETLASQYRIITPDAEKGLE